MLSDEVALTFWDVLIESKQVHPHNIIKELQSYINFIYLAQLFVNLNTYAILT